MNAITPLSPAPDPLAQLQAEFAVARQALLEAEEALASEQAAVNAFRMHCRLKIGWQVEKALALRTDKQRLLTRLQLLRQAQDLGIPFDEEDPFWQAEEEEQEEAAESDLAAGLPLFTDVPHDKAAEKRLYRQLARRFHPDLAAGAAEIAYRTSLMAAVNNAYSSGDLQTLRELAGELDPAAVATLDGPDSQAARKVRQHIIGCRRRKRKAEQELKALRRESTAQLWRKAKRLEEEGLNWWDEVRLALEAEIERTAGEVAELSQQLALLEQSMADNPPAGDRKGSSPR